METIYKKLADTIKQSSRVVLSIEGGAAAGKTTLAKNLQEKFGGNLYHMDDFFLPPSLRTEKRRATPGGNVYYERFYEEVVWGILSDKPFSYGVFDCKTGTIKNRVFVPQSKLHIVEGVYSAHPYFGDIYTLRIFLDISKNLQRERILKRNPATFDDFIARWIPMEDQYFSAFSVREKSDYIKSIE